MDRRVCLFWGMDSGVTGRGAEPKRLLTGKFFADVSRKKRQEKNGKGVELRRKEGKL